MTDTTIKGTGNSRTIGSVADFLKRYPTYEAFGNGLINKEIPIDLGGLNSAGVQTSGTPYNKASVLPNTTCTNLGIATSSVPKDAFDRLRTLVQTAQTAANNAQSTANSAPKILLGSYTGTSTEKGNSETNPMSLTFSFAPKLLILTHENTTPIFNNMSSSYAALNRIMRSDMLTTSYVRSTGFRQAYGKKSADGKTFYWYSPDYVDNILGRVYYYVAIG